MDDQYPWISVSVIGTAFRLTLPLNLEQKHD
jgi:hypothetical protein